MSFGDFMASIAFIVSAIETLKKNNSVIFNFFILKK